VDLGKRLKEARERADLSQEALARRADVSTVAVSQIEQGRTKEPHYHTLHRLSKVLGVSPHWLYTGEELEEPILAGKAEAPEAGSDKHPAEEHEEERRVPSLGELLERAGAATRWFVMPHEEWLAAFRGRDTAEAAQKLVDIARQMKEESKALMPLLFTGPPDPLGNPTLPREYLDFWQQAAQRRIRTYLALENLEKDAEAPEILRYQARRLAQRMREGFGHPAPPPEEHAAGMSYVS